jgi:hypothetical protein
MVPYDAVKLGFIAGGTLQYFGAITEIQETAFKMKHYSVVTSP